MPDTSVVITLAPDFELTQRKNGLWDSIYYNLESLSARRVSQLRCNWLYNVRAITTYHASHLDTILVGDYIVRVSLEAATRRHLKALYAQQPALMAEAKYVWVLGRAELTDSGFPIRKLQDNYPVLMQAADSKYYQILSSYDPAVAPPHDEEVAQLIPGVGGMVFEADSQQTHQFRDMLQADITQRLKGKPFNAHITNDQNRRPDETRFEHMHQPSSIAGPPLFERVVYIFFCDARPSRVSHVVTTNLEFSLSLATGPHDHFQDPDLQEYQPALAKYRTTVQQCYTEAVRATCSKIKGGRFNEAICTCQLTSKR